MTAYKINLNVFTLNIKNKMLVNLKCIKKYVAVKKKYKTYAEYN